MMLNDVSLVVGDVHIAPKQSIRRAAWLGRHIEATKPRRVVFIGDFLTFDSLSAWDRDKRKKMELRRYSKDVESGIKFLRTMDAEISDEVLGNTEWVFVEGNHEERLWRYLDIDPTFHGYVDYRNDLGLLNTGRWHYVPYRESYVYRGVHFTHVPIMENGRPVSGKHVCSRSLDVYGAPVVFGHTHKFSTAATHRKGQPHLQMAVNVGCYFEHIDEYAQGSQTSYWRGLVEINHYKQCAFDVNAIRLGHLKRMYG